MSTNVPHSHFFPSYCLNQTQPAGVLSLTFYQTWQIWISNTPLIPRKVYIWSADNKMKIYWLNFFYEIFAGKDFRHGVTNKQFINGAKLICILSDTACLQYICINFSCTIPPCSVNLIFYSIFAYSGRGLDLFDNPF